MMDINTMWWMSHWKRRDDRENVARSSGEIEAERVSMIASKDKLFGGRILAALEKTDIGSVKDWRNQQTILLRQNKPLTDADQEAWYRDLATDDTQSVFGLRLEDDTGSRLIGYCALVRIDRTSNRAELSFLVDPSRAANDGLYREDMFAALALLCRHGFEVVKLHRIYTETFAFRKEHIAILEEFGFVREGVLRAHQYKNGEYVDSILHSILDSEWKGIEGRWFDGLG
jgi:RimJ/RimL family protein N-acetyltransferase